jgi:RNA polymerase sigma-70 factor (ECF subfamily)
MSSDVSDLIAEFERHRPYVRAVALRMLGSGNDADDAVQEAWMRLSRAGGDGIEDLRAWLTTVTSRVCLDMLRNRRARREVPVSIDLDELLDDSELAEPRRRPATPEEEVLLAESVGIALHVVMESLSPAERVAFVLHDIFALPFVQVADVLDRSTAAVKMLASRARNRVRLAAPEQLREDAGDRAVVDAFFAAAGSGDLSALLALLAPDVQLHVFTPEGSRLVTGAKKVAAQAGAGARRSAALRPVMRPVTVRRSAGVLIVLDGRPMFVLTFTVQDGLITEVRSVDDPDRLAQIVPSWAT